MPRLIHHCAWSQQSDVEFRCSGTMTSSAWGAHPGRGVFLAENGDSFAFDASLVSCPACLALIRRVVLEQERKEVEAKIDAAYWRFTRCARALPPVLAEPAAYERRRAIDAELAALPRPRAAAADETSPPSERPRLPPCRCGDPDRFHEGPCRPPTTLENVIRSPRFYALLRDPDDLEAGGWVVLIRNGDKVEQLNGPREDAVTAAALRISALDESAARLRRIHDQWGETLRGLADGASLPKAKP